MAYWTVFVIGVGSHCLFWLQLYLHFVDRKEAGEITQSLMVRMHFYKRLKSMKRGVSLNDSLIAKEFGSLLNVSYMLTI